MTLLCLNACSMQGLQSKNLSGAYPVDKPSKKVRVQQLNVQCPACDDVAIFDGFSLSRTSPANSSWTFIIPEFHQQLLIFATARGQQAVLQPIRNSTQPVLITMPRQHQDSRSGTLSGIIADTSTHTQNYGIAKVYPNMAIQVRRGRAVQTITTDQHGLFNLSLATGQYNLMVQGKRYTVDVPKNGSAFLPIILHHTIMD